jgi:hypothetical protein
MPYLICCRVGVRRLLWLTAAFHQLLEHLIFCLQRHFLQLQPLKRTLQLLRAALAHRQLLLLPVSALLLRPPAHKTGRILNALFSHRFPPRTSG